MVAFVGKGSDTHAVIIPSRNGVEGGWGDVLHGFGEGARLEFRANFYNLFNKLNLASPQTDILNAHFGEAQNALGARTIELQARFNF